MRYHVDYSRGQLKIQQMAFVLVAIVIFFSIVGLFYINIRLAGLENESDALKDSEAGEIVRKLAAAPEFAWTATDCASCIDLDKVMILKERESYKSFWELDYLQIEVISPEREGECNKGNYPECRTITIINKTNNFGSLASSFVALCRQEFRNGNHVKCELGKIYAGGLSNE